MSLRFLFRNLKARWRTQRTELEALLSGLDPSCVALDVGSHKGSYLMPLHRRAARVVAFEPQPALAALLDEERRAWRMSRLEVRHHAVGSQVGEAELLVPRDPREAAMATLGSREGDWISCPVPVTTLDEEFLDSGERIGAIKIDVEGHELAVLEGGAGVLARDRPVLVVELEERHLGGVPVREAVQRFEAAGYRGELVTAGGLIPASRYEPSVHQRQDGERFWDRDSYANNFVFRPRR